MREITKRFVEPFDKRSPFKIKTAHNRKKEENSQRNGGEEKRLSLGAAAKNKIVGYFKKSELEEDRLKTRLRKRETK